MDYQKNALTYEDYYRLRESVGWQNFSSDQAKKALSHSFFTITAVDGDNHIIGMGRLIGDGLYYLITDVVIQPDHQSKGIGTEILNQLINHVYESTPAGGRSSVQLIAERGKEVFYEKLGFKRLPGDFCGAGMRKVILK